MADTLEPSALWAPLRSKLHLRVERIRASLFFVPIGGLALRRQARLALLTFAAGAPLGDDLDRLHHLCERHGLRQAAAGR